MPGCLFYFCAEWRRARKVLQLEALDAVALRSLLLAVGADGELRGDNPIARQHGIEGWKPDAAEAAELAQLLKTHGAGPEVPSPANAVGTEASLKREAPAGTLLHWGTLKRQLNALSALQGPVALSARGKALPPTSERRKSLGDAQVKNLSLPTSLLFLNPTHPFAGLRDELYKEEFVQEVRRRLGSERLFGNAVGQSGAEAPAQPVLSLEDAEDLFETLLLMQRPSSGDAVLQTGRPLDAVVDMFFALSHFRRIMDRGASSLSGFFSMLDKDKNNIVEAIELRHFFKNADSECLGGVAAALATEGLSVSKMAETLFSVLDTNRDQKVELWELQRQLSLVVPPRTSLVEFIGHLEMKHGFGKCGINREMDRAQMFDHFCHKEMCDVSPEDVVKLFRAAAGGRSQVLAPSQLEALLRRLPLEVSWGVEPHVADKFYCALGTRALVLARSAKQDSCMPLEAVFEPQDAESPPDQPELRARFERLWDRAALAGGAPAVERQLWDGCFRRYLEAVQVVVDSYERGSAEDRRLARSRGPRSLFPNVGDVLAAATTRLYAGQVCVVRYRLQGAACFLHPARAVLKDEREPLPWPVGRKVIGDTPFIGLVPRGLSWTNAGGGGFYLGQKAFTRVDPNLRADLPRDTASGLPLLFGCVEIVAPSLTRTARSQGKARGTAADFELRLFCSSKGKITGCIGEPLPVQVVHQVRPPPVETLQVRCEGRCATLRWATLDLGPQAPQTNVDAVWLHVRSDRTERTFTLDPDATEWELQDLAPDTEYEVRVRLENRMGCGREASASCRTNTLCSAPASLSCAVTGTTHVELRWPRPRVLGNETTRDQHQLRKEAIERYEATLKVEDDEKPEKPEHEGAEKLGGPPAASTARVCQWAAGTWREDKEGCITARLGGLRPDTRYSLEGLCAVNSMGRGQSIRSLVFWTVPQTPRMVTIRVRHGLVLIALSQVGGVSVKEYSVQVLKTSCPEEKSSFTLPSSNLRPPADSGPYPELSLPFEAMPTVVSHETHTFQLRVSNAGGWSEWSRTFETTSIARQQGAEQAQAALIQAIESHSIAQLAQLLEDVRGIEFSDERYVREATLLLAQLTSARHELDAAMEARDPGPLRAALQMAMEVRLPDLKSAEALLQKLEAVVAQLESAKGIDALRLALRAAYEAQLPQSLLANAVQQLGTREAAQQGLEQAMEAARVPGLMEALRIVENMHLPSQGAAEVLLAALQESESLLKAALKRGLIFDLVSALESAQRSGLREDKLIQEAEQLLAELRRLQRAAEQRLSEATERRHPDELRAALANARKAQVLDADLREASALLDHLDELLARVEAAEGVEERAASLAAAEAALLPPELLAAAGVQLQSLRDLIWALGRGAVEALRLALKTADACGIKAAELTEARAVHRRWSAAAREVEVACALQRAQRLRGALEKALAVGINQDQLEAAEVMLATLERRDAAEAKLREAMAARRFESLSKAFKTACDAEVASCPLLDKARRLIERLLQLRADLAAAEATDELQSLHVAMGRASTPPALPEKELAPAERRLQEARQREAEHIAAGLRRAEEMDDFRTVDALIIRSQRAAEAGVEVDGQALGEAAARAVAAQESHRQRMEQELQRQRTERSFPRFSGKLPEEGERTLLPARAVTGELRVKFEPSGIPLCTLPREIVESTLVVVLEQEEGEQDPLAAGVAACEHLLRALRALLTPEDDMHKLSETPVLIGDDGQTHHCHPPGVVDGKLELGVAVYVRGDHSGLEIAEALCERERRRLDSQEHLHFHGFEDHGAELPPIGKPEESPRLRRSSTRGERADEPMHPRPRKHSRPSLRSLNFGPPGRPPRARLLTDHTWHTRSRVLRRVTLDLSWTYPKGIMDILDAACIVFDEDYLVEIVDRRGTQGAKYGASGAGRRERAAGSADALRGAVRHSGDVTDTDMRTGKQVMSLRLDLLPQYVTDMFFVLSTCNSRDLSKFAELKVTVYDADSSRVLAEHEIGNGGTHESAILCSIHHLDDGLWRVNGFHTLCKGTSRDYRQILARLLDMGYPRNVSMRNQVPVLLSSFQSELRLPQHVKSTAVELGPVSCMRLGYAIELFDDSPDGEGLVRQIAKDRFKRLVARALRSSAGERFSDDHLDILPASAKTLEHVKLDLRWRQPTEASAPSPPALSRQASPDSARYSERSNHKRPPADHKSFSDAGKEAEARPDLGKYLDGACVVFEEQALREVVDYRGAHGVRLVCNGVLDYRGVWAGKVGVGDATGGSIWHSGEAMDNAARTGMHSMQVCFDKLPEVTSELFLVLSTSTSHDISEYSDLHVLVRDAENPGHEIACSRVSTVGCGEAIVMSSISRGPTGVWSLGTHGCTCQGNARDYRPLLLCLRAIQERRHSRAPPWPHQVRPQPGQPALPKVPLLPRLPESVPQPERRASQASTESQDRFPAVNSIGSFVAQMDSIKVEDLQPRPASPETPSISSHLTWRRGGFTRNSSPWTNASNT